MITLRNNGFVALASVLILAAIFLSISIGVASQALSGSNIAITQYSYVQARALSDACAEYALMELARVLNYGGDESILIDGEECDILPIIGIGDTEKIIMTKSTIGEYTYRTRIVALHESTTLEINAWEEVVSF